jgi:hypothetical protein
MFSLLEIIRNRWFSFLFMSKQIFVLNNLPLIEILRSSFESDKKTR